MMLKATIFLVFTGCILNACAQNLSFSGGHSHNDYEQERPLFDALEHGMVSIEADVFFRDGDLLVGHTASELQKSRTLESLYLEPLMNLAHNGKFDPILLLVDIKDNGEATYQQMKGVLEKYRDMLSEQSDGKVIRRQVTVVISGSRPVEMIRKEKSRYVFIDGRMNGTDIHESSSLFPLISDDWNRLFTWRGQGKMPENELGRLHEMVETCHKNGKMIRFWGIPDESGIREKYWKVCIQSGVDLIGCDCPVCLEEYLATKGGDNLKK